MQWVQSGLLLTIATVGAWIAWQQMGIARVKLQHDLYDRRYAIFQATRTLLLEIYSSGTASDNAIRAFSLGTADAVFLLSDDLATYLQRIRNDAVRLQSIHKIANEMPPGDEKTAAVRKCGQHFSALIGELNVLTDDFLPYLRLDKQKNPNASQRVARNA